MMEKTDQSVGVEQGSSLKKDIRKDSKMTQSGHISVKEDCIRLEEKAQKGDVRSCHSMEIKTEESGASSPLQSSDHYPIQTWTKTTSFPTPGKRCFRSGDDMLSEGLHKKEQKPKKAGKYVCHYCGRACAKPSVLKKHIRSHTGERPYPCAPCGFSFKTKSNLYKHRKSHTHAVKAGLALFSEQDSKNIGIDEELAGGDGEMQSDADQSTDTDEELVEEDLPLDRGGSIHIKDREDTVQEECSKLTQKESARTYNPSSAKQEPVSSSGKVSLWQFRELTAPAIVTQVDQEVESSTVKQRLALRLSEKRSQDSDQSLSLPSSYSKGSTDSGYFSRSESAEQQFSQPSASAKSYQEIMFGKCYRPSSKPRQSITVQTCMTDINETTSSLKIKLSKDMVPREASYLHSRKKDLVRSIKIESESFHEEDFQEIPEIFQSSAEHLGTLSESGLLLRSNSLPTPSDSSLSTPQGLRSSNSFDERMTGDEVSYRGSVSMRKLMRQTAFEHSAHEAHTDSDHHTSLVCGLKSEHKVHGADESKVGIENYPEFESCLMFQSHMMENATRKRRKGKNTTEEDDFPTQNKTLGLFELSGDFDTKYDVQESTYSDTERRAGSNVISVIQHTNSLSKLNSTEKSTDLETHLFDKSTIYQLSEKEQNKERHKTDLFFNSGKTERQLGVGTMLYQRTYLTKQLASQTGIQVPEIRVTEEPDKPEKGQDVHVKPKEKHGEEFQWPQRSETLSKFPVEKLPPKKKRLRLADIECSSGESSFESACTSLSRSPSQDSNLSHSSSFSQSLDREENINVASPAKLDEFSKPLEFLSVPGDSLTHHREMRRSASEQAPCNMPMELQEFRSKSFDYGNLSSPSSTMQGDICVSARGLKERRRGYLVRQASLSADTEILTHDKSFDFNVTRGSSHRAEINRRVSSPDKQPLWEGCSTGIEKMRYSLIHGIVCPQQIISKDFSWKPELPCHKQPLHPQTLQSHDFHGIKQKIKKESEDSDLTECPRIAMTDQPKDHPGSVNNVLSTIAVLSQAQPALASRSFCGLLVPVRIQMQVPCYGKITYTSISHILDSQNVTHFGSNNVISQGQLVSVPVQHSEGYDLSQMPGHSPPLLDNPQLSPAKLKTGIPLSLTSRTISTTEAPSGGANKRMLSPASSVELFIEATQQKRAKDEKMYGQIVEELSAVELGHPRGGKERFKKENRTTSLQEEIDIDDPDMDLYHKEKFKKESRTRSVQEEIDIDDPDMDLYHKAGIPLSSSVPQEAVMVKPLPTPVHISTSQSYPVATRDAASAWMLSQFPSLHTTTCVSWCYLNSAKPNCTQTAPNVSVYASWLVSCHNPNPSNLSTGMVLALLRSKQKPQNTTYTLADMYEPGKLVTSTWWSQKQEQVSVETSMDHIQYGTRVKDIKQKSKSMHEDSKDTEVSLRQAEPVRVKIFEGGYKSNEDYVYVRGRGRGKYICEECGIRCKKPSMLKKHIRTHTDVRPYVCKCCNFAFKTKGNLTKHMKSKAHTKKCLELGVSPMAMDNTDVADHEDDVQKSDIKLGADASIKHQFSDADDSEGGEEDGDEPDDEEDDEYDGDSTPRTLSRSTSPQPFTINKPFPSSSFTRSLDTGSNPKEKLEAATLCNEDDLTLEQAGTSFDPCPPLLLSPCWESPHQRYICPRGDHSPQGHLSPGRDTSPLRAISPRSDLSIRGDLSPIRQLSPVRPVSPGTDLSRNRAPSPHGRHRCGPRAASPRQGSYQHRAYLDHSRGLRFEVFPLRQTIGIQQEVDQREGVPQNLYISDCHRSGNDASTRPQQDVFSHLPLHSQRQVPTPIPMVPIGGLRMPSVSPSGAVVDRHSQSLPRGDVSERAHFSQSPFPVPVPGRGVSNPSSQRKDKPASCISLVSKDKKQEESVHICAQAIASLRITSEDITYNPPGS
ncbi:transcription factor HIVEP2 [Brachyhypopomus gauderio]|uniref:transcription factor HIVEP2 n=1 Tax=Brachyhypopomus gauderio TaxID=698409 RepID=UPI0040414CDC